MIKPDATARSLAVKEMKADESVFRYADNGVARAGLTEITRRLEVEKLAIFGLGGTGSYILDLVAKTPVKEIHLFDDDVLLNHNAFRAPGAPTLDELRAPPLKVNYFAAIYGRMHRGIRPHAEFISEKNLELLDGVRFAFLCFDDAPAKVKLIEHLEAGKVSFYDRRPTGSQEGAWFDRLASRYNEHRRKARPLPQSSSHERESGTERV